MASISTWFRYMAHKLEYSLALSVKVPFTHTTHSPLQLCLFWSSQLLIIELCIRIELSSVFWWKKVKSLMLRNCKGDWFLFWYQRFSLQFYVGSFSILECFYRTKLICIRNSIVYQLWSRPIYSQDNIPWPQCLKNIPHDCSLTFWAHSAVLATWFVGKTHGLWFWFMFVRVTGEKNWVTENSFK